MLTSYTGARCPYCEKFNETSQRGKFEITCTHCGETFELIVRQSLIHLGSTIYISNFIVSPRVVKMRNSSGVTTGKLISIPGEHQECVDCGLTFPELIDKGVLGILYPDEPNKAFCNGHAITLCPWCRPDYQEYHNGA